MSCCKGHAIKVYDCAQRELGTAFVGPSSTTVVRAGAVQLPRCTLPYCDPDTANAVNSDSTVTVSPACDIWALGVMCYEAIAQKMALTTMADVFDGASGTKQFPWEAPAAQQPDAWRRSRLRSLIQPCLSRDASTRPTAAQIVQLIERVGSATNMA